MNKISKIAIGWIVWTVGALVYAHLCTNYPNPDKGEMFVEAIYAMFSVVYLCGVPILTGLWVAENEQ